MKLKLTGKPLSQSIVEQSFATWQLYSKNIKTAAVIFGVLATLSFILGIISIGSYSMIHLIDNKIYFNLNLLLSLGLSSLIICLYFLLVLRKNKALHLESAKVKAINYDSMEEMTLHLGNEYFEIDDGLRAERIHWKLINHLFFVNHFIFISASSNPLTAIAIDLQMVDPQEIENLKKLLAQKIG